MSETREVLAAISRYAAEGRPMALGTIVSVTGSTYRRPGARLLVPEGEQSVGNLSGGCLEGEVESVAREVMADGTPRVAFYDLTADDEVVWGWGLGCNGAIEVFVEPAARAAEVARALGRALDEERPVAVVSVLESAVEGVEVGARVLVYEDSSPEGSAGPATGALVGLGRAALERSRTEALVVPVPGGEVRVFVEAIEPPPRLLVCGAGHDAIPLVAAAASLGWRVVVVDDRAAFLTRDRFPGAAQFVETKPADVGPHVDPRTCSVVMSHNYLRDRDYLRAMLDSPALYVGMLGPGARLARLLDDLRSEGIDVDASDLSRVHGPAGIDVGAEGPEEIAVALVAEILAVWRGRSGGFLKKRTGPIHDRPEPAPTT